MRTSVATLHNFVRIAVRNAQVATFASRGPQDALGGFVVTDDGAPASSPTAHDASASLAGG